MQDGIRISSSRWTRIHTNTQNHQYGIHQREDAKSLASPENIVYNVEDESYGPHLVASNEHIVCMYYMYKKFLYTKRIIMC